MFNEYDEFNLDARELSLIISEVLMKVFAKYMNKGYTPSQIESVIHRTVGGVSCEHSIRYGIDMRKLERDDAEEDQ